MHEDILEIAGIKFRSRLWVGTGKYVSFQQTKEAVEASGADVVTVAVRRTNNSTRYSRIPRAATRPRTRCATPASPARPGCPTW